MHPVVTLKIHTQKVTLTLIVRKMLANLMVYDHNEYEICCKSVILVAAMRVDLQKMVTQMT